MQLAEFWYAAGSTIWWTCAGLLVALVTSVVGVWFFGVRWARRVGEENSTWIAERQPRLAEPSAIPSHAVGPDWVMDHPTSMKGRVVEKGIRHPGSDPTLHRGGAIYRSRQEPRGWPEPTAFR